MERRQAISPLPRVALRMAFTAIAVLVTVICVIPYLGVLAAAVSGSFDTLAHLAQTVLGRYATTTLILVP